MSSVRLNLGKRPSLSVQRQARFWTMLTPHVAAEVESLSIARNWPSNAVIFRQGDPCDGLHIIRHGLVKVYVASASGREQTISLQQASSVISFVPLMDRGAYATSARTLLPTRTLFLSAATFDELVGARAEFRKAVFGEVGRMLRGVISLADSISLKPVPSRVAFWLLEEANRMHAEGTWGEFRLKMTQHEFAHLVGATRESVSRAFGQLRGAGVIEQQGARVRILDPQALAEWAQNGAPVL